MPQVRDKIHYLLFQQKTSLSRLHTKKWREKLNLILNAANAVTNYLKLPEDFLVFVITARKKRETQNFGNAKHKKIQPNL